jgi:hypothetical protein
VVSLFTKVLLEEALENIFYLLSSDDTLEERTNIPADAVCEMTELCLRATYFQFEDQFYEQVDGAALGSPLSPIIANLYMEGFENKALATATSLPTILIRYVDNTFVLWPHGTQQLEEFHTHLNKQHPQIQFTREEVNSNQISFLDVLVKREDGAYKTTVYRKSTHTDRYTDFISHHHPRVKSGTIVYLVRRAQKICDDENRGKEITHIRSTFMKNGYPTGLVSRILKTQSRQRIPTPEPEDNISGQQISTPEPGDSRPPCLFLPYVQGLSEKIKAACKKIGVRTTFKSLGMLRRLIMDMKMKVPQLKKKEIVHKLPCQDCEAAYIGETGRALEKRITEHKHAVRTNDRKNGIAVHAWDNHRPDWEAAEIVEKEPHYLNRRELETI